MKSFAQFILVGFIYCIAISQANGNDEKEVTTDSAADYLANFGYITPKVARSAKKGSRSATKAMKSGLKEFQKFAHLEPTGELDEATKAKMEQTRCGNADVGKKARAGAKWQKTNLTYTFLGYTSDTDQQSIKAAMRAAYDAWSEVTPLRFTEVSGGKADFTIGFYTYSHGDNGPFDGRGGTLAHAYFPTNGRVHFDDSEDWLYMTPASHPRSKTDLYLVALHELGHAIGLEHSTANPSVAIMAPFYSGPFDKKGNFERSKLLSDDIRRIKQLYR